MKHWWLIILRIVIGGVFIWAGVVKAVDPAEFARSVEGYRMLSHTGAVIMSLYLPWLEIVCGSVLIVDRFKSGSLVILSVLLGSFIAAMLSAWWRSLDINCGCFGSTTDKTNYAWLLLRDLLLFSGLLLLIFEQADYNWRIHRMEKSQPETRALNASSKRIAKP